jgi:hypothetical protein
MADTIQIKNTIAATHRAKKNNLKNRYLMRLRAMTSPIKSSSALNKIFIFRLPQSIKTYPLPKKFLKT